MASACTETQKVPAADPRAYRGSDRSVSLSVALQKCGFRVPVTSSNLNYFTRKDPDGLVLLVKFTTDKPGYADFLKSAELTKDDLVAADSSPFDDDGTRVGWKFDARGPYLMGGATRESASSPAYYLTVDVTDATSPTIYMQCVTE